MMPADTQEPIQEEDTVEFPELDDGSRDEADEDDFGADQLAFDEDADEDEEADGLEVGIDEAVDLELDPGEEQADWAAGSEDAAELMEHDLGISEPADGASEDFSDDSEGLLEPSQDSGFASDPEDAPVGDDGDEGLEIELADDLPGLPLLDADADDVVTEDEEEAWAEEMPPLPSALDRRPAAHIGSRAHRQGSLSNPQGNGPWIPVAPGIRWRLLTDVEQTRIERPQGRSELCLHALSHGSALVYLGQLYRLRHAQLHPVRAMGLRPNPLALTAASGNSGVVWAVHEYGAQLSQDGGANFSPPVRFPRRRSDVGGVRGATTRDGTLWFTQDGELFRLGVADLAPRAVACEEPPVEIASDGNYGLLVVGATGRTFASLDGGRRFTVWPGPESLPQSVQLCGDRCLLMAAGGWILLDEDGYRHLFTGSAQLGTLGTSAEGHLDVYAFVHTTEGWHLVRMPTNNKGSRPSVALSKLPADVGVPRFLLVYPERGSTIILVGADHAFVHIEVPNEDDA